LEIAGSSATFQERVQYVHHIAPPSMLSRAFNISTSVRDKREGEKRKLKGER